VQLACLPLPEESRIAFGIDLKHTAWKMIHVTTANICDRCSSLDDNDDDITNGTVLDPKEFCN